MRGAVMFSEPWERAYERWKYKDQSDDQSADQSDDKSADQSDGGDFDD